MLLLKGGNTNTIILVEIEGACDFKNAHNEVCYIPTLGTTMYEADTI